MDWKGNILEKDDEEDEQEERSHYLNIGDTSDQELEDALERKQRHVYTTFVEPVLEDGGEKTVEEVMEEIRPPYSEEEIRDALEYGVENEGLEYISEDGSVKKI